MRKVLVSLLFAENNMIIYFKSIVERRIRGRVVDMGGNIGRGVVSKKNKEERLLFWGKIIESDP